MASKVLLTLTVFATMASVILSLPSQNSIPCAAKDQDAVLNQPQVLPADIEKNPEVEASLITILEKMEEEIPTLDAETQVRAFNNLFNLSAALAGAPNNTGALTFVPLITILASALGG